MSLMIGDRIPQKKPENTAIEIIPHRELEITETISINCPFCGYGRGYSEIIKTGFGDEGDVFVLYCGKCGKAVRREGGPVGWG
jgi:DNA-directed RNA polymerase subunit M/transcription elongation factor TFIIS